ncbi:hypothetical protein B1R94_02120 [Mycolicibacterium litorale]|nr:hypothetical protein B1R94_02120 [Mycolicibacterium litorale]
MSVTSVQPTLREWLHGLVSRRPHQVIGGVDDPYLLRWHLIPRNPVLNIYLHKFLRSDDDRALHDHPWWFVSLILRGQYDEITDAGTKRRRAGSIAYRPATWRHRVALLWKSCASCEGTGIGYGQVPDSRWMETDCGACDGSGNGRTLPCWTIIVTGRRARTWGFWCRKVQPLNFINPDDDNYTATSVAERFIPWTEFGDAGCGEAQ